jgi:hypothetical protein
VPDNNPTVEIFNVEAKLLEIASKMIDNRAVANVTIIGGSLKT